MFRVCLLILALLPGRAWGAGPDLRIDIRQYSSLQAAFYDDPDALLAWMKTHYAELKAEQEPEAWVRATLMFLNVMDDLQDIPGGVETLIRARDLAQTLGMNAEFLVIGNSVGYFGTHETVADDESSDETERTYQRNIQKARDFKVPRLQALYIVGYAGYLLEHGEVNRSLQMLLESARIIEEDKHATLYDTIEFKIQMAAAFIRHGQTERALRIYEEIDAHCQTLELRFLCGRNANDLARAWRNLGTPADLEKAEASTQKALRLSLQRPFMIRSSAYFLLADIALARKDFRKAAQAAQDYLDAVASAKSVREDRPGLLLAARAYHGLREDAKALHLLQRVEKDLPADDSGLRAEYFAIAHPIHKSLGHTAEALRDLEEYVAAHHRLDAKTDKETYQTLMVRMGLAVEEQRVKILSQENDLQNQRIRETERFRIMALVFLVLLILIIALMVQSHLKSRAMRQSRIKMQRILDHIDEGILTINHQLQIDSEYSKHLHKLLDDTSELHERPALDVILRPAAVSAEERSILHETLSSCLGEDAIAWELNEAQLPTELRMGQRTIALNWQPIIDEQGTIRDVILSLRDISNRKDLEAAVASARGQTQRIMELAHADIDRCAGLLDDLQRLLEHWDAGVRPRLHTAKGLARTLGLKALSEGIHETEGSLLAEPLAKLVAEYQEVLRTIFKTSAGRVTNLAGVVSQLQGRIHEHLQQHQLRLQELSLEDRWIQWSAADARDLESILIHALTNALDHGFIRARDRGKNVPPVALQIETQATADGSLELIVRDNGVGLDWQKLSDIARERQFVPEGDQQVSEVLFLEGVSTAETTSMTSGRGVGLTAIRQISQERQGTVRIADNDRGRGTMLIVRLPQILKKTA